MVRRHGFHAMTAQNGKEAVALCEERRFDLILMDLQVLLTYCNTRDFPSLFAFLSGMPGLGVSTFGCGSDLIDSRCLPRTHMVLSGLSLY